MEEESKKEDSKLSWFKFYAHDWLTDLKIVDMSSEYRICYLTLLCLASVSSVRGSIKDCTEKRLIRGANFGTEAERERAKGCIQFFISNGMITNDNGIVTVKKFAKRQGQVLSTYERVKKHREKMKLLEENKKVGH